MTASAGPTRRAFLAGTTGLAASVALARWSKALAATPSGLRHPDSLPDPSRPAGTPDPRVPIDHVIVVMMENHSFDNYLGLLARRGQPAADGFTFDGAGKPSNSNPTTGGVIRSFHMPSECQMEFSPSQAWTTTRTSIDGGAMTGFVKASGDVAMGYWDDHDLPFYYSLAKTFSLANRWFASATVQTYPNRRFLMAGTAYGLIGSDLPGVNDAGPPNGTIFDRLNQHGISWKNYFTDLPELAIIPSAAKANLTHLSPITQFFVDAAAGQLPALSLVDPDFGIIDAIGSRIPGIPPPSTINAQGTDEENPQNVQFGEQFVATVVDAVIRSPNWPRTLLVWLYDEHGGYYDHVPPPAAIAPDNIAPRLGPKDTPGDYDLYGVRVPAVVVSPWSKPASVTSVVHDHTSVLAFVEQKWNL
ncbi:MAG TPA: alkaline phosphatase family protein, partial [Acidimicrobiales bacterium]|nr:alkaline phosphatase family protein [Acidimicrobiales bacterium]